MQATTSLLQSKAKKVESWFMVVVEKRKYWKMPEILYAEPDFDAARGLIRIEKLSYAGGCCQFCQV